MKNTFTVKVKQLYDDEYTTIKDVTTIHSNLGGFLLNTDTRISDNSTEGRASSHIFRSYQFDGSATIIIDYSDDYLLSEVDKCSKTFEVGKIYSMPSLHDSPFNVVCTDRELDSNTGFIHLNFLEIISGTTEAPKPIVLVVDRFVDGVEGCIAWEYREDIGYICAEEVTFA